MPADAYSRMDSSSSDNGADKLGSSPSTSAFLTNRIRTESEGSDRQIKFILPGAAGSPPKVLTMEEVQKVVTGVENMALAHEIAVNPSFRLEPYEPPVDSLEKNIKEMVHKAFWNLLREQLNSNPPCYDHAIQLLGELKEDFTQIMLKNNEKALMAICEILDETVIRQQAEQGVLDFKAYANLIIEIMAKSCAPIRDEQVAKLKDIDDVVDTFRGIFETMALLKLDMANCLLIAARKDVIAHSIEYEKEKFKEFLTVYNYDFPATENWLMRHKPNDTAAPNWCDAAIQNAYIEFLDWNAENEFPEIMSMDKDRLLEIGAKTLQVCIAACLNALLQGISIIGQNGKNKKELLQQIIILLQGVNNNKDIEDRLNNIWLQIKRVINEKLQESGKQELDAQTEESLKNNILHLSKKESPVRSLIEKRLFAYARVILSCKVKPAPPPGFIEFADELEYLTAFKGIVFYNYTVFGEQYHKILMKLTTASEGTIEAGSNEEAIASTSNITNSSNDTTIENNPATSANNNSS